MSSTIGQITITEPAQIANLIPYEVSYLPHASITAFCTEGPHLVGVGVYRFADLDDEGAFEFATAMKQATEPLIAPGITVVLYHADETSEPDPEVLDALLASLGSSHVVDVADGHAVCRCGCSTAPFDPRAGVIGAAEVARGRTYAASRDELVAAVNADPELSDQVAAWFAQHPQPVSREDGLTAWVALFDATTEHTPGLLGAAIDGLRYGSIAGRVFATFFPSLDDGTFEALDSNITGVRLEDLAVQLVRACPDDARCLPMLGLAAMVEWACGMSPRVGGIIARAMPLGCNGPLLLVQALYHEPMPCPLQLRR